jgi:hypothetical protein
MELADLARWTPVRLDFSGPAPTVDWANLSAERFAEPFFDQTVVRWASGPRARPVVRTGLEALVALDSQPSLEPAGMIFTCRGVDLRSCRGSWAHFPASSSSPSRGR